MYSTDSEIPSINVKVVMNRIATLLEPGAGKYGERIDSEWVFGHHLRKHGVSVRLCGQQPPLRLI